jgi:hypothetical protein
LEGWEIFIGVFSMKYAQRKVAELALLVLTVTSLAMTVLTVLPALATTELEACQYGYTKNHNCDCATCDPVIRCCGC